MSFAGARRITPQQPRAPQRADELRSAPAPRRARPPAGPSRSSAARAGSRDPGRACSSERASDLRRWAKASRTSLATSGDGRRARSAAGRAAPSRPAGRGVNTARSTRAQQPHLAGELDEHARRRRRCASPARRAAGRRSRAGPSPSSARAPAARRSCAGAAASRSSRAGWRPSGSAPGRAPRGRVFIASPKCSSTFGVLGGDRLQRRRSRRSSSTTCTRGDQRRELLGQRPLPAADLEHDVVRARPRRRGRSRSSRFGSARKFWPKPAPRRLTSRRRGRAFASTVASSSA